jgi:hypothetical protein
MNLFLEQKTTPLKSKLAKLFAIFLVCFFVGISANSVLAQVTNPAYQTPIDQPAIPSANPRYTNANIPLPKDFGTKFDSSEIVDYGIANWPTNAETNLTIMKIPSDSNAVYRIFTSTAVEIGLKGAPIRVTEKYDPVNNKWVEVPNLTSFPSGSTNLIFDPVTMNMESAAGGPLKYERGGVIWTDKNGIEHYEGAIQNMADYNNLMAKIKADDATNGAKAEKQLNNAMKANTAVATQRTSNAIQNNDPTNSSRPDMSCEIWKGELMCVLAKAIYYITIKPASWLLAASGWLLDSVFMKTVVNLKATLKPAGDNSGFYGVIRLVWGIFRDLINMSFIFLLLSASIKTIIFADTTGLKKTITNIVIVALLMNFSLFFVELAIDVSNNFAVTIYNSINQGSGQGNNLAAAFMKNLGMETLMGDAWNLGTGNGVKKDFTGMITICIFGSVFILVLAVVFFVMAILFVVRFIEFIILMMMSPIGMGSIAIPKLASAFPGGNYWTNLLSQCFFAPIMFIFLWISIKMLDVLAPLTGAVGTSKLPISGMMTNGQLAAGYLGGYILGFTVIIFILIKGMEYAKSLSAKGASGAQAGFLKYSGANWAQNKMQNAPRGVGAFAGRNIIGRGATRLTENAKFREWASNNAIARTAFKATQKTANAGFGGKTGFMKTEEAATKARETFAKDLLKPSLKEVLAKEKLDKANKVIASQHIEEATEKIKEGKARKEELDREIKLDEENTERIDNELKAAKEEFENKKNTSGAGNHFSDSVLEAKISALENERSGVNSQAKKDEVRMIEGELAKNDQELKSKLKDLEVGYDKNKHDEWITKNKKDADKIRTEDKLFQNKSIEELKKITRGLKEEAEAGKERQKNFVKALSSSRLPNLGMPSKASKQAAFNLRKEMNKSKEEKDNDKLLKQIREMAKDPDSEKPKDKPVEPPKTESKK